MNSLQRTKITLKWPKPATTPPAAARPTILADQAAAIARREESRAVPLEVFYLVWAPAKTKPPRYRHATLEGAQAEADRLRGLNPGIDYHVYHCEQVTP